MQLLTCRGIIRQQLRKTRLLVTSSNKNQPSKMRKPDITLSHRHPWQSSQCSRRPSRRIHLWIYSCERGLAVGTSSRSGLKHKHLEQKGKDQKFHRDIQLSFKKTMRTINRFLQMSAFPRISLNQLQQMPHKQLLPNTKEPKTFIEMCSSLLSCQPQRTLTLSRLQTNVK